MQNWKKTQTTFSANYRCEKNCHFIINSFSFFQFKALKSKTAGMQQKHNRCVFSKSKLMYNLFKGNVRGYPQSMRFPSRHESILVREESGVLGEKPCVRLRPTETQNSPVIVEVRAAIDDLYASLTPREVQRSPSFFSQLVTHQVINSSKQGLRSVNWRELVSPFFASRTEQTYLPSIWKAFLDILDWNSNTVWQVNKAFCPILHLTLGLVICINVTATEKFSVSVEKSFPESLQNLSKFVTFTPTEFKHRHNRFVLR